MRKKISLIILGIMAAIGVMILLPIKTQAKELKIKDYGNGFYLPEDFDLRDSDGKILTAPKLDTSLWGAGTYEEEQEMQLDNGLKAVKWWKKTDNGKAFPCVSVYNESGKEVYRAGRDNCNELVVYMGNEEGDTMLSHYTKTTVRYEDGTTVAYVEDCAQPRSMEQYYADERRSRSEGYNYDPDSKDAEPMITANETYWDGEGFRERGETIINGQVVSSYRDVDVVQFDDWEFTVQEPVALTKEKVKRLEPCFEEGDTHICPSYTSLLEGQPLVAFNTVTIDENGEQVSTIRYYLKEHLEIMEENGFIIRPHLENGKDGAPYIMYDVIKKECPLYLYDELLASEPPAVKVTSAKAEEMFKKQDELLKNKKAAIIKGEDRQAEVESDDKVGPSNYSEKNGEPTWTQKIVGDVVPISGGTPVYCVTRLWEGHVFVEILDANMQLLDKEDYAFGTDYTNYEYVYFTMIDILDNGTCVFMIAGTDDAGKGGNLNRTSMGDVETENGMTGNTTYYQDWGGGVGVDSETGQPFEY